MRAEPRTGWLELGCRLVAMQAALVTASIHLLWVASRLASSGLADPVGDGRSVAFVAVAFLLVAVAAALFRGYRYRRLAALGGGTLAALVVGYVFYEGEDAVATLAADPLALIAVLTELVGVAAFAGLYSLYHPDRFGDELPTASD